MDDKIMTPYRINLSPPCSKNGKVHQKTLLISMGRNDWFTMHCHIPKGDKTSDNSIFA